MTKKHFELVARVLRENADKVDTDATVKLAVAFATEFTKENPRFDAVRFLKAAGFKAADFTD
jgi:hypothetical protein